MALPNLKLRIEHADGTEDTLSAFSYATHYDFDEESRAEITVSRADWTDVESDVDRLNDEFYVVDSETDKFGGRFDDISSRGTEVRVRIESPEADAKDAVPTAANKTYIGVDDTTILQDRVDDVSTLSTGTTENVKSGLNYSASYVAPAVGIRDLREQTGAEIRYDGTGSSWQVDYVASLGTDRSGSLTLGPDDEKIGDRFDKQVDRRQEVTHLLLLGGEDGPSQREVALVPDSDSPDAYGRFDEVRTYKSSWEPGDTKSWAKWENKEVIDESRLEDIGKSLLEEYDGEPRYLEVDCEVYDIRPRIQLGDTVELDYPEESLGPLDVRVVSVKTIRDKSGARQELTLSTRQLARDKNHQQKALEDIDRFNSGFGGFVDRTQAGGDSRQPVSGEFNAKATVFYPSDVVEELRAEVLVELLPYRAFSSGGAGSVSNVSSISPDSFITATGDDSDTCQTFDNPDAEEGFYQVSIADTEAISAGTEYFVVRSLTDDQEVGTDTGFNVDYEVENVGSEDSKTQTIELKRGSTVLDSEDQTLDSFQSAESTLSWSSVDVAPGDYTLTVESNDDSDTLTVTVIESTLFFDVTINSTNSPVVEGETLTVDTTIENTGTTTGQQKIKLKTDGETRDSEILSLSAGDSRQITLEWDTAADAGGDYTATVESVDDSDTESVSVNAGTDMSATITNTNSPVLTGNSLDVTADITNNGTANTTQTVTLEIDGGVGQPDSQNVTVAEGNTKTVTLSWETELGDEGDYTATVATDDDSDTESVSVNIDGEDTTGITQDWHQTSTRPGVAVAGTSVYCNDFDSNQGFHVESRSISDGSLNWETPMSGAGDLTLSGALYMHSGGTSGEATSINTDGSVNWTKSSSNAYDALGSGGYTVIGRNIDNGGTDLIGLNTESGDGLWATSDPGDNLIFTVNVIGNSIYYTDSNSTLYKFNIDKSTDNKGNTTYNINDVYDVSMSINPQTSDYSSNTLYLGASNSGKIEARNLDGGSLNWSVNVHTTDSVGEVVYHNNAIYSTSDDTVVATALDGSEIWSETLNHNIGCIAASGDKLFIGDTSSGDNSKRGLYAYDLDR